MERDLSGIIIVNKPYNWTSFKVVRRVRKILGIRKVGHAGTLDPIATGVLIILVGRATKKFKEFVEYPKEYEATIKLGESTTTGDIQGQIKSIRDVPPLNEEQLKEVLSRFEGKISQVPPMVSALHYKGKRLYQLARKNITVERMPRQVHIYKIKLLKFYLPYFDIYLKCSRGTYVRKLAEDIGEVLNCGAHITKITRISVGPFRIEEAISVDEINVNSIRSL